MSFKWKDEFKCNVSVIDEQHQGLFELGSRIFYMASLKDGIDHYDEIIKVLEELKEYTQYHFNFEEKLMLENGYPQYEIHKVEHDLFIKKIQRIGKKDLEDRQSEAIMELITFVADWITSHILKTDMQYKEFFNQKGIV